MPGRFYYAPVDPGYLEASRGIARGIYGATDQLERAAERERRRPTEDLERAVFEAQARGQGVHRGAVPTETIDFGFDPAQVPDAPDFRLGPLFAEPEDNVGLRLSMLAPDDAMRRPPELGGQVPTSLTVPHPDFEQLDDGFYMERPEARARRAAEAERAAEEQRLARLTAEYAAMAESGRITPHAAAVFPGLIDEFLRQQGIGGPYEPVRGTPEYLQALEGEEGVRARYRRPSGQVTPAQRYAQGTRLAHDLLGELRQVETAEPLKDESPEAFARWQEEQRARLETLYDMTADEALRLIREGPDDAASTGRRRRPDEVPGTVPFDPDLSAYGVEELGQEPAGGRRGEGGRSSGGSRRIRLTPAVVDSARKLLRGTPRDEAEDILAGQELDAAQIEEILGPGGRGHPLGAVFEELTGRR